MPARLHPTDALCALAGAACLLLTADPAGAQTVYVGPHAYRSVAGVPPVFYAGGSPTALENFEDCSPDFGITENAGVAKTQVERPGCLATHFPNIDSVDADDGAVDGTGADGASWVGINFFKFVFATPVTAAGLVYTDGPGPVYLEAFGPGDVSLGQYGPFTLDNGSGTSSVSDDYFLGVKDPNGIESLQIYLPSGAGVEVDHVQYGDLATLTATWDDGQAIQGSGGLNPALWVGLELQGGAGPTITTPNSDTVVLTYTGLDPNETLQVDVASYGLPFYPPDPIQPVGNQVRVVFMDGTMTTLTIDIAASSGDLVDPLNVVGFNPQPEPPSPDLFAFDPAPSGGSESLAIQVPLTGGTGPAGATQISLTLQLLDNAMAPLPTSPVAVTSPVPALAPVAVAMLAVAIAAAALLSLRARAATV